MAINYIYVHLDVISNSIFSKGISISDFERSLIQRPQNLLLLDPSSEEGEYEPHTGLKVVRGEGQVNTFFTTQGNKRECQTKWIDFKDISFLQQLSPMEIAELLYFGHMTTQLHSPFFYKLQNNYVYFGRSDSLIKIYYRHLDEFYRLLEYKIRRILLEKINDRKGFFKKPTPVEKMDEDFLHQLRSILQEGVVFDFSQQEIKNKKYTIPIYVVEDQIKNIEKKRYSEEELIASLIYDTGKKSWILEQKEWEFLSNLRQA